MKKIYFSVLFSIISSIAFSQPLSAYLDVMGIGANCQNNGVIEVFASGGTPPYTYSIDGGSASSLPYLTNLAPGSHSLLVTDAVGATYPLSAYISDYSVQISVLANPAWCTNPSTIEVSPGMTNAPPPFQYSIDGITWQSNGIFTNLPPGTYTAYITDGEGCSDSRTVILAAGTGLSMNAGTDALICAGSSTQLTATATSSSGSPVYQWSPSTGLSDPNIANPIANPSITTVYTLSVSDGTCTLTDNLIITVDQPVADAGADATICAGNSITLSGSGGLAYNWTPSTGLSSTTIASPIATPAATTEYILTTVSAAGCTAQDAVVVTVDQPVADAGPDFAICLGNNTTLSGSGGLTYSWTPSTGLSDPSVADPIATPSSTTEYVLTIQDAAGCTAQDAVIVLVSSLSDPQVSLSAGVLSVDNPNGSASYTWQIFNSGNWEDIPGATGTSYTPTVNANYRVMAILGPCTVYSASILAGRPASTNPFGIYLYPNPATSVLRLDALESARHWETLEIINSQGKRVLRRDIANRTEVAVNIAALGNGIYIIRLRNHEGVTTTIRFLKRQ